VDDLDKEKTNLSHVGKDRRPRMVDITAKVAGVRVAVAATRVRFPPEVAEQLLREGLHSAKGPIVDTAIVAGVMAAKRTHELIPFCHPLPIERCEVRAGFIADDVLGIECEVATTHKTGVEMEALTGASVAALTVYDMCKALSHAIEIGPLRLLEKSGGKRRVRGGKVVP
jgi:cyclic pyranopterin phosphate synthase